MKEAVDDVVRVPEWATPSGLTTTSARRVIPLSVGYVALYLTLDRLSFIGALHGIGITPWDPSTGLALSLLITGGLRFAPLVMVAELLSGATLPIAPLSPVPVFLEALVVTATYTGAAAILRGAGLRAGIRGSSDAVMLLIVTVVSSGLVAGGFVGIYAAAGVIPWGSVAEAAYHFWIGDAIGIAVFVPPLLLLYERVKQGTIPTFGWTSRQLIEFAAQGASIVLALLAVFSGTGG